ncbi:unnamed protein product [Paramecium octaurelia]|uniref:G domain-containing protein n=1 Tax=Paramecium octaurelia TaxID=43137 RepID=A0A8S1XJJ8_PAROT|nr:unnamed protein product [Paramecium octaurelia]
MSIVLLGQIGSGKTTLYNKITLSQEKTKAGGNSVTLNVFMKKSSFGSGFKVLDTPGFGSDSQKIDHIAGVLSALSEGPVNRIAIIVKFARTDVIIEDVKKIIPALMNYRHLMTVIVTCWDYCDKSDEATYKNDIQAKLAKYKINSTMFVGKNDASESICEQIDQIIARSTAENVNLTDAEIFQSFDMEDYDDLEILEIEEKKASLITAYRKFSKIAKEKIEKNNISKGLLTDYLYAITQFAKQHVEDTMKKFENDKFKQIDKLGEVEQLKAFQIHFQLKSTLFFEYEYIVELAQKITHKEKHFSKFVKKCYHCGQIWFKSAGCEGPTYCGRLNDDHTDEFLGREEAPQQFKVAYIKDELIVTQVESAKPQQVVLSEKNKQNLMMDEKIKQSVERVTLGCETFNVGGMGCRKIIEWQQMKPLTDEEMKEILGILDLKLCEKMVEQEKLTKQKTLNQQIQYQNELNEKIKEQKAKLKKAA